jgi:hypothetical protein
MITIVRRVYIRYASGTDGASFVKSMTPEYHTILEGQRS